MALVKNKNFSHSILILIVISFLFVFTLSGCDNFTESTPSTASNTSSDHAGANEESNIILQIEITIGLLLIASLLQPYEYPLTHIASTGGFLGRKNATIKLKTTMAVPSLKRLSPSISS